MKILSGKEIRPLLKEEIQKELKDVSLSFYLYSNKEDYPSQAYLNSIKKMLSSFSIPYSEGFIDSKKDKEDNLSLFKKESEGKSILMARPLKVDYEKEFLSLIPSCQDPDMLTNDNRGYLFSGDLDYLTATSQSVRRILSYYQIPVEGKKAVVLGRSTEVGYSCFQFLNKMNAATTLLHSKVDEKMIQDYVKEADILVLATGKSGLIKEESLHPSLSILDCGFNPNGGDLGFIPKEDSISAYTPVPGGVGALTSYCLLLNAIHLKKKK